MFNFLLSTPKHDIIKQDVYTREKLITKGGGKGENGLQAELDRVKILQKLA